jgi:uncharacterized protein
MIKQIRLLILGIFIITASSGCSGCLVNYFAFHPEKVPENTPPIDRAGIFELFLDSGSKTKIHCFYFENKNSEKVVLYLHGNAGNAYHRIDDAHSLRQTGTNVLLIDYRGFGKSEGSPSEEGIYEDTFSAYQYLINDKHFDDKNLFILGRSIGTTAAIHIAQHKHIGGLILITPLSSGREMAGVMDLGFLSWVAGSSFDNVGKAKNIKSPVLVIHGDRDRITPIQMGEKVYQELPEKTKKFITVPGAGHNDLVQVAGGSFWLWIQGFMQKPMAVEQDSSVFP